MASQRKLSFAVLFIVAIGLVLPLTLGAAAPQPAQIAVTPFLQTVQIGTEPSKSLAVSFSNPTDTTQKLVLSITDFGSLDQSGGVAFVGPEFSQLLSQYNLSPWLKLKESSLTLGPHQSGSVAATITNSKTLAPGGHYGAIIASLATPAASGTNPVSLQPKISSLILLTKVGGEHYDLALERISADGTLAHLPSEAKLLIKDTGNVHIVPRGMVKLIDGGGKLIGQGIINEASGYVLPGTSRLFTVPLHRLSSPSLWGTRYRIQVDYRYDGISTYASQRIDRAYINPWLIVTALATGSLAVWLWNKRRPVSTPAKTPRSKAKSNSAPSAKPKNPR